MHTEFAFGDESTNMFIKITKVTITFFENHSLMFLIYYYMYPSWFIFDGQKITGMNFAILIEHNLMANDLCCHIFKSKSPGIKEIVYFVLKKHV